MSASTTSVSSAIGPFYTTDLEAKVACVLDRSKFLDAVTDAINYETTRQDANEMVAMMVANGFVPIIAALLSDRDTAVRRRAYLALGNMIASENKKMSFLATTSAVKALDTIGAAFNDTNTKAVAAFVFSNIAQFLAPVMAPETRNNMRNVLEKVVLTENSTAVTSDLLRAGMYLEAWNQLPTQLLLDALDGRWSKCFRSALRILSEQIGRDNFGESYRGPAFQTFRTLLLSDKVPASQFHEFLFAFSNLVVEPGVADMYLNDDVVVAKTCDIIEEFFGIRHSIIANEATFILVNAIARQSTLASLTDTLLEHVENTLLNIQDQLNSAKVTLRTAVNEALNTLGAEKIHRADLETEKQMEELLTEIDAVTSSDEMEIDTDDDYAAANLPCEKETLWPPVPCHQTLFEFNPPSALDILARLRNNAPTSVTVNNLIRSVEAAGGAFVPMPENTILTVADLSALEARGFTVVRGCLGINAALTTIAYGF